MRLSMWWDGAETGAAAAVVLFLLAAVALLLCRRRRKRVPRCDRVPATPVVHIVRDAAPPRVGRAARVSRWAGGAAPRALAAAQTAPNDPPAPPPTTSNIPKIPLPEQWIHKPIDYRNIAIPRPIIVNSDLESELVEVRKYSVTRSPSLEKDDKSPFLGEVFGFDADDVRRNMEVEMADSESPSGNLRRFRSMSTRLNMCSVNENPLVEGQQERSEMQNSPRILDSGSNKGKGHVPKFDFSPCPLSDSLSSPRFYTPPDTVSPMYYEASPRSVYYDSVRSPKFFPETPKNQEEFPVPQSPRAFTDMNRNNSLDKPNSPRILNSKPKSPKVYSYNKENYFTFDNVHIKCEEGATRVSPRPRRYYGRNSIEKERFTPPADKEAKKYRRHNSCDTNYKETEVIYSPKGDRNDNGGHFQTVIRDEEDVVDCCAKFDSIKIEPTTEIDKLDVLPPTEYRRHRLKSISLDSDSARIIEQNLELPIAKEMKEELNERCKYQDMSTSCESMKVSFTKTVDVQIDKENVPEQSQPDVHRKTLRHSSDTQSFIDMPRFSPKEFEVTVTNEEGSTTVPHEVPTKRKSNKNLRNLTIDLTKRDSELEKEIIEFEKLYTDAEDKKVKTPTLKVKATSLDSSESVNLSLPQKKTLDVPQNSISVPNTPKRQLKRILGQKTLKSDYKIDRRFCMKQDSGVFLRDNRPNLVLFQPSTSRSFMSSFDENPDVAAPEINISGVYLEPTQPLLNYKPNLSVSSTNLTLKTLPEGVTSDDFEPSEEDDKLAKKLHRRNSNQSLMISLDGKYSTHSFQSSNSSLNNAGTSCHNLSTVRTSMSNYCLSTDRKKLSLDSNAPALSAEQLTSRASSNTISSETQIKNGLLQRRGSNSSLTLNIASTNLSRHSSNTSLNKDVKKKNLLERRSSNTSLSLSINTSNPQLSVNRGLSISNYNLDGAACTLSRYNSNQNIDNSIETKAEPRALELDESIIGNNLKELPHKHRKSLSTENLIPKSYRSRIRNTSESKTFGSHDNLWSTSYVENENVNPDLTYVCGGENEIIFAIAQHDDGQGFVRNITTKPLSPQTTSEDFRSYLANMQHLQNASSVLSREKLKDLNELFQNGYSEVKCESGTEMCCCNGRIEREDASQPCCEYQKAMLRSLHQEFWDMPTNFQEKPIVSGSHTKNRYRTILPNEHSRVSLVSDDCSATEAYINANFIKGHEYTKNSYIATQGPLQNTIYDFWLMVYQNKINHDEQVNGTRSNSIPKVVMLTNFIENNRQKCEKYFPLELNEEVTYNGVEENTKCNSFHVKNCGVIQKSSYTIRNLKVKYTKYADGVEEVSEITVYHFWFHNWPDHTCPKDVNALLNLSLDLLRDDAYDFNEVCAVNNQCLFSSPQDTKFVFPPLSKASSACKKSGSLIKRDCSFDSASPPTIVHCSAGIGRTGCLIAILNGIQQLSSEKKVDVLGIVCNMRLNRGGMVQSSEQYELIHKVLCLFEQVCLTNL